MTKLSNKKVAILVTGGFEEIEFTEPKRALEEAGATVEVVAPKNNKVKLGTKPTGVQNMMSLSYSNTPGHPIMMHLCCPGGVMNPDSLRQNSKAIQFGCDFIDKKKPIAAICHAPQLLIETGMLKGRTLTSSPSLKTDLINAGANWVNLELVIDRGLVTSRKP